MPTLGLGGAQHSISKMADITQRLQEQGRLQDNADIAQADHDYQWKRTFDSTPPADVLRSRLNVADTVDRAIGNKLKIQAQSDVKALEILQKTAKMDEWNRNAPMREQLARARIEATGATERRKAEEAALEANHTANLNRGIADLYKRGLRKGTPEFIDAASQLIADNPHADGGHVMEIGKLAGFGGDTPEEKLNQAVTMVREKEKARLALQPTLQEKVAEASQVTDAREKAKAGYRLTPEQKIAEAAAIAAARAGAVVAKADTYEKFNQDLAAAKLAHGVVDKKGQPIPNKDDTSKNMQLPAEIQKAFEERGLRLQEKVKSPSAVAQPSSVSSETFGPPATAASAAASVPELTDKSQFDALPSGAEYIRDGRRYRKP